MRRSIPALIVLAALGGAALTGCSSSTQASDCSVTSGNGSDSITASGKFGKAPKAKVPSPLTVKKTQATTLIQGHGARVAEGGAAELSITLYDATSGAAGQTQSGFFPITADQIGKGLTDALTCAQAGSRIAVVVSPKDDATTLGAAEGGTAVAVVDVESALPGRATGKSRPATPGFPTVVLAPSGQPGIVIGADTPAPTKVDSAVLKQGDGRKTKKSDTLIVQSQTVTWSDKTTATGTWEQGAPSTQTLNDGSAISKELIGKTVGSQVEVLVPKSKSTDGEASVTVIDILGVLPSE